MNIKHRIKSLTAVVVSSFMMCSSFVIPTETHTLRFDEPIMTAKAAASDFTADDAINWVKSMEGIRVGNGQCVGLINEYLRYLGIDYTKYLVGVAADFTNERYCPEGCSRIPGATPQKGDILVYTGGDGGAGHVAIYENASSFYQQHTFDRYGNEFFTVVHSSYNALNETSIKYWGVLRPNFKNPIPKGHIMEESEAAGQTIPDGDYWIYNELDMNYGLDISAGEYPAKSETNVALCPWKDNMPYDFDTWTVKYNGDGFYKIMQKGTNICLDVYREGLERGTNVQVCESNSSPAQEWSISPTTHGYKLQARCNAFFLDVNSGIAEDGRNIHVWEGNETKAQHWCFIPAQPARIVKDGTYKIHSALNENLYVDVSGIAEEGYPGGANIQIWDETCDDAYKITYDKDGYYYISEVVSDLVWDVNLQETDYLNSPRNIALFPKADQRNKRWAFIPAENGNYYIISELSGYPVDLAVGSFDETPENGTNINQYIYHGKLNQQWKLERVNTTTATTTPTITTTTFTTSKTTSIIKSTNSTTKATTTTAKPATTTTKASTTTAKSTTSTTTSTISSQTKASTTTTEKLSIEENNVSLKNGEQYTIKANQTELTYSSNNKSVAVVSKDGIVTAIGEGEATISVINADSDVVQLIIIVDAATADNYKLGDVNVDNIIDGRDATDVLTEYAKTSTGQESKYTEEQKKAADVNKDGILDGRDATAILTYYAKTSTGYSGTLEEYMESIK